MAAALPVVVTAVILVFFRDASGYSDSPLASRVGFADGGMTVDILYVKCRGAATPELKVWEQSEDGDIPWMIFPRTNSATGHTWLARRDSALADVEQFPLEELTDHRIRVDLEIPQGETVEISDLLLGDLPDAEGNERLLGDGERVELHRWQGEVLDSCT
jgi:hypothetical protein